MPLGVAMGARITFVIDESGDIKITAPRYPTVESLRGAAGSLKKPLPWDEMRDIAREDRLDAKHRARNG